MSFELWTKQDIWRRHCRLWETLINTFHYFIDKEMTDRFISSENSCWLQLYCCQLHYFTYKINLLGVQQFFLGSTLLGFCFSFIDLPAGGIQQETRANEQETHQLCSHPEAQQGQPTGESLQGEWWLCSTTMTIVLVCVLPMFLALWRSSSWSDEQFRFQRMLFSCRSLTMC